MEDRPTFLKFANTWVNLDAITHIQFDDKTKTASVFFGSSSVTASAEAYRFFKQEPAAYLFTKSV